MTSFCFFCNKSNVQTTMKITLCCGKSYCSNCFYNYVKQELKYGESLPCFNSNCSRIYSGLSLNYLLISLDLSNFYLTLKYKNSGFFGYCKKCKKHIIRSDEHEHIYCPDCKLYICRKCCLSHDFEECSMQEIEKLIEDFNLISCPVCNYAFEKIAGCNSIRCKQCGVKYCGNCKKTDYYIRTYDNHNCENYGNFVTRYSYESALGENINPSSDEDINQSSFEDTNSFSDEDN